MIAAYIRVSSKAQSHAMQRHAIEQAAGARGETIGHWYEEKQSARTIDRAELKRLRADIHAGKVRRVYVYRLDRLARSGIRDTFEVIEEFRRVQCALVSVNESWFDLSGPIADMLIACMAWAAQMERLAINERISTARERMEADGLPWGRRPSFDEATAKQVRAMAGEGGTVRGIAAEVGLSKSAVSRILSRKVAGNGAAAPVEDRAE